MLGVTHIWPRIALDCSTAFGLAKEFASSINKTMLFLDDPNSFEARTGLSSLDTKPPSIFGWEHIWKIRIAKTL